eukprot:1313296-Rhodomonas_salina.1
MHEQTHVPPHTSNSHPRTPSVALARRGAGPGPAAPSSSYAPVDAEAGAHAEKHAVGAIRNDLQRHLPRVNHVGDNAGGLRGRHDWRDHGRARHAGHGGCRWQGPGRTGAELGRGRGGSWGS